MDHLPGVALDDEAHALYSTDLEQAARCAAIWHRNQSRRASDVPYVQHVTGVALILARLGFETDTLIAALLHDAVEDTEATLDQISDQFGPQVAEIVAALSERKLDENGHKRPWIDRKTEHLAMLRCASIEARGVALADKLHNLTSILVDLAEGRAVWASFHADREQVLWYHEAMIDCCAAEEEPRIMSLVRACRRALAEVIAVSNDSRLP